MSRLTDGQNIRAKTRYAKTANYGAKSKTAGRAWNKGLKGIHLSPQSEFKKGLIPWNKGLKGIQIGGQETQFAKGSVPTNKLPVGSTVLRRRARHPYRRRWIKIAEPNKWELYARFLWQQHYGDIPKGHCIHHIDGDSVHDEIDNLACLTRSQHMAEHKRDLLLAKARTL